MCALLTILVSCASSPENKPGAERWSNDKRPPSERESESLNDEETEVPDSSETPRQVRDIRPASASKPAASAPSVKQKVAKEHVPSYRITCDRKWILSALATARIVGTVDFVTEFLNRGRSSDDQIFVLEEAHLPDGSKITEDGLVIFSSNAETVKILCAKNHTAKLAAADFATVIERMWEIKLPLNTKARDKDCGSTRSIEESWASLRSPQLAFLVELDKFHNGVIGEPEVLEPLFRALKQADPNFAYETR